MKNYTSIKYAIAIFVFAGLVQAFTPANASAATVYLESSRDKVTVGDTVIVSAKINAEGVTINTVEGDIILKTGGPSLVAKEFSLANSSFGLWPRTPSLSKDGLTTSFVGGVPGGFNIEGATLFKIVFEAMKEGSVMIAPQNIIAYANDGQGTKLPVQIKGLTINVGSKKAGTVANDEWSSLVASDVIPPESFIVVLGQDKTLFDGKKFAFFSALDNQSGISYYEVSENGMASVRSGSTYVLRNQEGDVKLNVTAFDKAGNKKVAMYPASTQTQASSRSMSILLAIIVLAIIIIVVAVLVFKKMKKSKNNAPITQ